MTIGKPSIGGPSQGKTFTKASKKASVTMLAGAAILTVGGILASCGSSQAEKSAPALDPSEVEARESRTLKGQFIDSAVSGLFYQTDTHEGFTDHNGYFQYAEGESVSFYIGNISLGSTTGASVVTPTDLTKAETLNDASVNILRLLQTLDYDGDPGNGISITTNTHLAASQLEEQAIHVETDSETFAQNPALLELIGQVTNLSGLIPEENAVQHFRQSQAQLQLADGS